MGPWAFDPIITSAGPIPPTRNIVEKRQMNYKQKVRPSYLGLSFEPFEKRVV